MGTAGDPGIHQTPRERERETSLPSGDSGYDLGQVIVAFIAQGSSPFTTAYGRMELAARVGNPSRTRQIPN